MTRSPSNSHRSIHDTIQPTVSSVFIDKLTLTYSPDDTIYEAARIEFVEHVKSTLRDLQSSTEHNVRYHGRDSGRGYLHSWLIDLSANHSKKLRISTAPFYPDAAVLRLEFNPRHYPRSAMHSLWQFLEEYLLLDDFPRFLMEAEVTRMDVAVDVMPLSPQSIFVSATGLRRGDIRTGDHGEVQSFKLGSNNSDRSYCIYDRDPDDNSQIYRTPFTTRFEARLRRLGNLSDVVSVDNPFQHLHVHGSVDPTRFRPGYSTTQKLFLAAANSVGLQAALQILGRTETRRNYIEWLDRELSVGWFDAESIWAGYPAALEALCLNLVEEVIPDPPRRRRRRRSSTLTSIAT
jgi:hypothetical protein